MRLKKSFLIVRGIVLLNRDIKKAKMFIRHEDKLTRVVTLIIFFIHKHANMALILSARDMDKKERNRYERK